MDNNDVVLLKSYLGILFLLSYEMVEAFIFSFRV